MSESEKNGRPKPTPAPVAQSAEDDALETTVFEQEAQQFVQQLRAMLSDGEVTTELERWERRSPAAGPGAERSATTGTERSAATVGTSSAVFASAVFRSADGTERMATGDAELVSEAATARLAVSGSTTNEAEPVPEGPNSQHLPREDAASRREKNELERALITSVYDTERAFLAVMDLDPARARGIELLRRVLETAPELSDRDFVLIVHARTKRTAFAGTPGASRTKAEDELFAVALHARALDDAYCAATKRLREQLIAEVESLPADARKDLVDALDAFAATDESRDLHFCRREMHRALRAEDRFTARLLAVASSRAARARNDR